MFGIDSFDYSDGAIAGQSGGTFWDYKNFAPVGHTGTASNWDNVAGAPVVASGGLLTNNSAAKREYNGVNEGDGAVNDPNSGPSSVAHTVYYLVTLNRRDVAGFFRPQLLRLQYGTHLFGKPFGQATWDCNSSARRRYPGRLYHYQISTTLQSWTEPAQTPMTGDGNPIILPFDITGLPKLFVRLRVGR